MVALASSQQARCTEHKVSDKTVQDVFKEPRIAALARAACVGDEAAVARAIKDGTDANGKGFDDVTPLYWAVSCQNLRGIEALLRSGANPNYMFGRRFSAVYAAATMKESAVLKLLLKYGGDPNTKDNKSNQTALERALSLGIYGSGWDNYHALLKAGADINRSDELGRTIAIKAAALNQYDRVAELLERGYEFDLDDLARIVQVGQVDPKHPQAEWHARVKDMLERKGVQFPVPPKVRL